MKRSSRFFSSTTAAVLTLSSLLSMGFTGVAHAAVQTCDWTGTTDLKFSTTTNWANCGGAAPLAGDIIRFDNATVPDMPASGVAPTVLDNDLGVAFSGVETYKSDDAGAYAVNVNALGFADGGYFEATTASGLSGKLGLTVGTVASGATFVTTGALTNAGSLDIKTYGLTFTSLSAASDKTLTLGAGVSLSSYQFGTATGFTLALQKGSVFYTYPNQASNSFTYNIVAGGGTGTATPRLSVGDYHTYAPGDQSGRTAVITSSTTTFSGNVTLNSDLDVTAGSSTLTTVNFTGAVSGSGAITRDENSVGKLITVSGELTNPAKTTALDGVITGWDSGTWVAVNQNETTTLNGTRDAIFVEPAGTLKGTGTVTNSLFVSDGGHVAPGNSPGCLTVGTLTLNGEYQFELGGTDPCAGYDQIKVTSTVPGDNNGNPKSTTLDANTAVLTTSRFDNYTPKKDQVFTIIDNQGPDAVNGTFKGLAEGATFTQDSIVFKISYVGGTGNDVTLTVQNVPTVPDTGFALVAANPILSLALMAGAAGALLVFARRIRPAHAVAHKSARRK